MARVSQEWEIDSTPYKYTVKGELAGKPFRYGSPPSVCRALKPQWLTMPALGEKYQERMMTLAHEGTRTEHGKRPIQQVDSDSPMGRSSSLSTPNNVSRWFQNHLAPRYRMKYVGRLGKDAVAKFTEELSQLCDEALHRNLDIIAGSPGLNLVLAAAEQDATTKLDAIKAASCETDMQRRVAVILQRHQIILEHILANQRTRILVTDPDTVSSVFNVDQVSNTENVTNHNSTSLRTMAWPRSTPCTDIAVTLANSGRVFSREDQTYLGLNPVLRDRVFKDLWNYEQKCWIVPDQLRTDELVRYVWSSCSSTICVGQASRTAQLDSIEQPNLGGSYTQFQEETARKRRRGSHDRSIYHRLDISGDSFSDDNMLDLCPDVEQEYLKILGLENLPVLQSKADATLDAYPESALLNQIWSDMVIRGTFIAFIGDWLHATKLCIRVPTQGILLISEPIANPLIPQFDDPTAYKITLKRQKELIIDAVIRKLDKGDHPWATPTETHLLDVMAGATLIALRLACKGNRLTYPDDVFQDFLPEEIEGKVTEIEESWNVARAKHAEKKKAAIQKLQVKRQVNKLSSIQEGRGSSGDPDPSMDKDPGDGGSGGGGDHSAGGSGGVQGSSLSRTLGSGKAESSGTSFTSGSHNLHLRIFDGDLYDSPGYDVFQPFPADSSVTSVQPQVYLGSEHNEHKMRRSLSSQSTDSDSSTAPSLFSSTGAASSQGTSVRSKDDIAHERRKGPPVEIFLFTCLQQSANESVWEAGADFPGGAGMVPVIAKLAFSETCLMKLIHENKVYSHLSRNPLIRLSIPTCYGVYYCRSEGHGMYIGLLLTSLVPGTTANQLNRTELMAAIPSIRDAVKALHVQGVTHGDIAGRNIIVHERKPTLIDFGNACITTNSKGQWEDLDAVDRLLPE